MTADPDATAADPEPAAADTIPDRLLLLQRLDTESDQLHVRLDRLPEREQLATRTEQLRAWERRRAELGTRNDELTEMIDTIERRDGELLADGRRLEAQLKTVIAPREAEALMHEIATVSEQRDELEARELDALGEMESIDTELTALVGDEGSLRDGLQQADEALARAAADIDLELVSIDERRTAVRDTLDPHVLAEYDRIRGQLGVAVAKLAGWRCDGCHLDLSAAEVDIAKDDAATAGLTDCPHCGRILVV